jgi:hypothetical protein
MTSLETGTAGHLHPVPYAGQVIFTSSGVMAVHAANPDDAAPDTPYTWNGYEAFYGSVAIDPRSRSFVVTVESSLEGNLVGQRLSRDYSLSGDDLVLTPTDPAETFRVTYHRHEV